MRASSYLPLPEELKGKYACLNIQNNEKKCSLWFILATLHPLRHNPYNVVKYQECEHESKSLGIQYPVDIKDIGKFEYQNNISVNVNGNKDKKILPLRITTVTVARDQVNLLYITAGKTSH